MNKKKLRRTLSDKEIAFFARLGERIGGSYRLDIAIRKTNDFLVKNRKIAMPLIMVVATLLFAFGFWWDSNRAVASPNVPEDLIVATDTLKNYDNLIREQQEEIRNVIDSVDYLLERGDLTTEDSLYIAWGITYLNNIKELQE